MSTPTILAPSLLFDRQSQLLDFCVGLISSVGQPAFSRVYVGGGDVALDFDTEGGDETLAVTFDQYRAGVPGVPSVGIVKAGTGILADLSIWAVRDWPTVDGAGNTPADTDLTSAAQEISIDRHTIMVGVLTGIEKYLIWPGQVTAQLTQVVPYGPEGNLCGTRFKLGVDIL